MKVACLLAMLTGSVVAAGIGQVTNSAPVNTMLVHADISPVAISPVDTITARLFFSTDNQQTWTERPMSRMAEPGYDSTWQAAIELPSGSGPVWYYVNADDGTGYSTQSPVNSVDTWPVTDNLLARVACNDGRPPRNPDQPWLDLTSARVGRSEEHFFVELTNAGDNWPTGRIGRWYGYSFAFWNPEAVSDTWVFTAIYVANIPFMISTGLFVANRYSRTAIPERIGDIDVKTSGNRLLMRCRIKDMTDERRFGPWPNSQGWLYVGAATQTITTGAVLNDSLNDGLFHALKTQRPTIGSNRPFSLGAASVIPDSGTTTTEFSFSVSYTDPDSNPPTVRLVEADNRRLTLVPDNRRYWRGTTFRAGASGFAPGNHTASFILSDGAAVETTRVSFRVFGKAGVEDETGHGQLSSVLELPTVVRGNLYLPKPADCSGRSLFLLLDSAGRKVADLYPGDNNVSNYRPGAYFVRAQSGPFASGFVRVLILR